MREEGVGAGGAAYHGRHGIRYEHSHSDTWLEELKQEEVSVYCVCVLRHRDGTPF